MMKFEYIHRTASALFCCKNIDMSLIENERQSATYDLKIIDNYQNIGNVAYDENIEAGITSQTINISNYTVGIYTVVIFREDVQVASSQLLVVR
ncbi:MAG: hypothetical protein ACI8ZX_002188 [Planctomycetota bacterium]|jgi:hypothetical protein